ncbi:uncharacterized protein FPRO_16120 [Fusarium proliferatum ET1]|uniref:Uncharacterized protein n=1 Tax=Fusarium proliferatum (strain ET1) TaxID=1227346 RepID=A0A1L7WBB8_FUSPR|nr:uncharacterized protein FPRO_16120 [Fusarium proliferatum ET1]CZR49915.1 uncharacterized protein FPRO_16120 [Fusarium proliferatum ET1]
MPDQFKCQVCLQVFATSEALQLHITEFKSQTQSVLAAYTQCLNHITPGTSRDNEAYLRPAICQVCSRKFYNDYALELHIEEFRSLESRLVLDLLHSQSHIATPKYEFYRNEGSQCPLANCEVKDRNPSNRSRHFRAHIPFIEPCKGCGKLYTSCNTATSHGCKHPLGTTWITERRRRLQMRASQEYQIAITFCESSKRKINRYLKSSKSTSNETNHVWPPLDTPASLNTDVNEPRPNKTLTARNGVVMANLEEARVVGKAVSNTGLFCMDDPGVTLQEAQNSGLFCLDDTADHVATFCEKYTSGWDSWFLVDGTDKSRRKRPLDKISS